MYGGTIFRTETNKKKKKDYMNRIFIAIAIALTSVCANAQNKGMFAKNPSSKEAVDYTPYMQGAVTEVDGKVVFSQTIAAPGKSQTELYSLVGSWASARFLPNVENGKWTDKDYFRNLEMAGTKESDKNAGRLVLQGNEELVFRNSFLSRDYTVIDYLLELDVKDGAVSVTMRNISYVYTFGAERERVAAEDYITDRESFNKKGKFYKGNRKFRVKTINLKDELFSEIASIIQ